MSGSAVETARGAIRGALALTLSASSFIFLLGMPWIDLGLWPEQELAGGALHVAAALTVLLVGTLVATGDRKAYEAATSRPIMVLLFLGVVGLALAPFAIDPWRSVHGALKHGVGALWHVEIAVLAAGVAVLLRTDFGRFVVGSAVVASVLSAAAYVFPKYGVPLSFHEWSGMATGAAALAFLLSFRAKGGNGIAAYAAAGAVALAVVAFGLFASGNRAIVLAGLAVAVVAAFDLVYSRRTGRRIGGKLAASVPVAIAVAGFVGVYASASVIEAAKVPNAPQTEKVLSQKPEDHVSLSSGALGTIWSRSWMIRTAVSYIGSDPSVLLHGAGWGSFPEAYERHARDVPGRMHPTVTAGSSWTYWDTHSKSTFHSHNVLAETWLAEGVIGAVLWLVFLGSLAASGRRGLYASTAIAVVSTFWFPVTHMAVAIAALIAAGSAPRRVSDKSAEIGKVLASAPAVLAAAGFAFAGFLSYGLASAESRQILFEPTLSDGNTKVCKAITAKFLPEVESNIYVYKVFVNRAVRSLDPDAYLFDNSQHAVLLSCNMRRYVEEGVGGLRPLAESLEARARLAKFKKDSWGIIAKDLIEWGNDVRRFLAVAPKRSDLLIPYMLHLQKRHVPTMLTEADYWGDRLADSDPVKWFIKSIAAQERNDVAVAKEYMGRAFDLGYANLVPVTQGMIQSVKGIQ